MSSPIPLDTPNPSLKPLNILHALHPPLTRAQSLTVSDQETEGTCYAHAISRMISRLFKVRFPDMFPYVDERSSYLYRTVACKNIFHCFIQEYNNKINPIYKNAKYDADGWNKENLSALLYSFIYKVITINLGCDGGSTVISVDFILNYFSQIDISSFTVYQAILGPAEYKQYINTLTASPPRKIGLKPVLHYLQKAFKLKPHTPTLSHYLVDENNPITKYITKLTSEFVTIVANIKTAIENKTFKPNLYSGFLSVQRDYTAVSSRYKSGTLLDKFPDATMLDLLEVCFYYGGYAYIGIDGHALLTSGFSDLNDELIIKNSHGENVHDYRDFVHNNRMSRRLFMDNIHKIMCAFCFPDETITDEFIAKYNLYKEEKRIYLQSILDNRINAIKSRYAKEKPSNLSTMQADATVNTAQQVLHSEQQTVSTAGTIRTRRTRRIRRTKRTKSLPKTVRLKSRSKSKRPHSK